MSGSILKNLTEAGFIPVPGYNREYTFVGSTESIQTITHIIDGETVAVETFFYDGSNRLIRIETTRS